MGISRCLFSPLSLALLWGSFLWPVMGSNTPFLVQSFFFDYNLPSQPVPIPVTAQCEVIHIKWQRGVATGPNPAAPYYLQVYTSTFVFPFIISAGSGLSFDWAVPFAPGTQYQICMFDKNGNTGGCQATYSVIPSRNTNVSCQNVTYPLGPLDIEAVVDDGPLSQYGWVNQCTDISVTPKNGTPPFTFTIAPALHPPYNITNNDLTSMNWTVGLSWASPFFISVVDSLGNFWANGPLHSGGNGPTACLADVEASSTPKPLAPGLTVGVGVGGLVVGALVGIVTAYFFMERRRQKERRGHFMDLSSGSPALGSPTTDAFHRPTSGTSSHYRAVPSIPSMGHPLDSSLGSSQAPSDSALLNRMTQGSTQYQIEPFVMPTEDGRLAIPRQSSTVGVGEPAPQSAASREVAGSHVYVVHHDAGRAPVSVYHQDGTEVVELPPRYIGSDPGGDTSADNRSEGFSSRRSEALSSRSDGRSEGRSDAGRTDADPPVFLRQSRRLTQLNKPRTVLSVEPST